VRGRGRTAYPGCATDQDSAGSPAYTVNQRGLEFVARRARSSATPPVFGSTGEAAGYTTGLYSDAPEYEHRQGYGQYKSEYFSPEHHSPGYAVQSIGGRTGPSTGYGTGTLHSRQNHLNSGSRDSIRHNGGYSSPGKSSGDLRFLSQNWWHQDQGRLQESSATPSAQGVPTTPEVHHKQPPPPSPSTASFGWEHKRPPSGTPAACQVYQGVPTTPAVHLKQPPPPPPSPSTALFSQNHQSSPEWHSGSLPGLPGCNHHSGGAPQAAPTAPAITRHCLLPPGPPELP